MGLLLPWWRFILPYFIKRSLSEIGGIITGADPVGLTLGDPLGDVLGVF